jgi:thioredoxin reductase (NADPH)
MSEEIIDIAIIGGGPGGLSAGIYASRGGKNTVLFELGVSGGQIVDSSEIENYPGFLEVMSGYELMKDWPAQAEKFGLKIQTSEVKSITKNANEDYFDLELSSNKWAKATAVILATGSTPKRSGIDGEDKFFGKGVSTCATCDGFFYKNKEVAVLGGGDTALEEAVFLSNICSKVHLIHRRDEFRAAPITINQAKSKKNINFILDSKITSINGNDKDGVTSLSIENIKNGDKSCLDVPVVFVFVGRNVLNKPIQINDNNFICDTNKSGEVVVDLNMRTSLKGLWAIGDVRIDAPKQVVCAAGDGAVAAIDAINYINNRE